MKTHPLSDEQASADQKSKPPSDKTHCQKRLLKHICKNNSGSKINCHSIMQYINTYFFNKMLGTHPAGGDCSGSQD